jgi:hypothetical protein
MITETLVVGGHISLFYRNWLVRGILPSQAEANDAHRGKQRPSHILG